MKENNYNILIVDDEKEYQLVVSMILEDAGYNTETCSNGREALDILEKRDIDLVITDLRMPVMSGDDLIAEIREKELDVDILVVTAYGSIESAVEAIKNGATDYFVKSSDPGELLIKVERISDIRHIRRKDDILVKNQNSGSVFLESKNPEYCRLLEMCDRTADTDISILLLGESGVGKEVIANYIHGKSNRKNEPFVPVNCQVFPEGVIESELFGHEKGAFTGAVGSRTGKFEEANYGTLFLDEIGDLPMTTQGKLLRALETKTIQKVGSNRSINLDVRFIFATNKDLYREIENGNFRDDLLYRINTLTLTIPPLRERREDLPGLIDFFITQTAIDQKKKNVTIDDDVMDYLLNYEYPGNVRELRNIIERMIALSIDGRVTSKEILVNTRNSSGLYNIHGELQDLRTARGAFEKNYISDSLRKNDWNVEKTAASLGITSRQLWNKIKQYDIQKK